MEAPKGNANSAVSWRLCFARLDPNTCTDNWQELYVPYIPQGVGKLSLEPFYQINELKCTWEPPGLERDLNFGNCLEESSHHSGDAFFLRTDHLTAGRL